jgi:hypothetical protein
VEVENPVVRRWFWAFENDVEALRELCHPDIAWFQIEEDRSPVHRVDDAIEARNRWLDTWDEHRFDLDGKVVYIYDHEDRASALEAVGLRIRPLAALRRSAVRTSSRAR